MANSVGPYQLLHSAISDLGLHYLLRPLFIFGKQGIFIRRQIIKAMIRLCRYGLGSKLFRFFLLPVDLILEISAVVQNFQHVHPQRLGSSSPLT